MAGVNRYTQLSTTQFNPLSMEELSVVPMAMRQRHDAASAQLENSRLQLNAMIDALPQHDERAKELVNTMNNQIDSESEKLNRSGFNNMTGSNIIKLNRDYQNLVSPNGELGKILSAKKDYAEKYKTFREDAIKAGQDSADIDRNWARHVQNYFGYDRNGNVSNINSLGAPKKVTVTDALKDIKSLLGETQQRLDRAGGGSISVRPDGSLQVTNKSGSIQQITNIPQLMQAQEYLKSRVFSPDGDVFRSAQFQGKSLMDLANEVNSGIGMMTVNKINDTTNYHTTVQGYKNPNDGGDGAGGNGLLSQLISANTITGRVGAEYTKSIGSTTSRIAELSKIKDRSTSENAELESLLDIKRTYENTLKNNKQYQETLSKFNSIAEKTGNAKYSRTLDVNEIKKLPQVSMEDDPKLRALQMGKAMDGPKNKELQDLGKKLRELETKAYQPKLIKSDSYLIADRGKTGDVSNIRGLNNSFASVLKSGAFALGNNFDITSVSYGGQTRGQGGTFDRIDKESIQGVLSGVADKDINVKSFRPVGTSGLVEYTIEVTPSAGNKANLNRWFRSESGPGTIGDGKAFQMTVVANNTSDDSNIKNIAGYSIDYISRQGPEGKAVAQAMVQNINRSNINTTFRNSGASGKRVTYKEFANNPSEFYSNPQELQQVTGIMNSNIFNKQYETGYFDKVDSQGNVTRKPLNEISDREITKAVEDYYNNNANNEIIVW